MKDKGYNKQLTKPIQKNFQEKIYGTGWDFDIHIH